MQKDEIPEKKVEDKTVFVKSGFWPMNGIPGWGNEFRLLGRMRLKSLCHLKSLMEVRDKNDDNC